MIPLILIHHVIGKQRYLRGRWSLIVPIIDDYVRAAENFKVLLRYEHALRALCLLVKLSAEGIFEECKNLNEFLNAPIKRYLISPC